MSQKEKIVFTDKDFETLDAVFSTINAIDTNNDLKANELHAKIFKMMNKFKEK